MIANVLLGLLYLGLIFIGAQASGQEFQNISKVELLLAVFEPILGYAGKITIIISLSLACLTTAIGLTCAVSDFFEKLTSGKLKYEWLVVACTIISFMIALMGVEQILMVSAPILTLLYPIAITLVMINLIGKEKLPRMAQTLAVVGSFMGALLPILPWPILTILFGLLGLLFKRGNKYGNA